VNSTVSGNIASVRGGGIHNINGIAVVRSDTFSGEQRHGRRRHFNQTIVGQPGIPATLTIQTTILQAGEDGETLSMLAPRHFGRLNLRTMPPVRRQHFAGGLLSGRKTFATAIQSRPAPGQPAAAPRHTPLLVPIRPSIPVDDSILART